MWRQYNSYIAFVSLLDDLCCYTAPACMYVEDVCILYRHKGFNFVLISDKPHFIVLRVVFRQHVDIVGNNV